jgi:hypothetical protein
MNTVTIYFGKFRSQAAWVAQQTGTSCRLWNRQ